MYASYGPHSATLHQSYHVLIAHSIAQNHVVLNEPETDRPMRDWQCNVKRLNLQSRGRWFHSQSRRYQVVSTSMGQVNHLVI